ncbi:uncharacterized protein [Haliotis cracherodii]|uniref:uncharacterized protein n=1 Tax=Haliotis cracherodii TaxID=6455 RepID=UPI0039EC616E
MAGLQNVKYIFPQRGCAQVLFNGYRHTKNEERQTCIHWKCVKTTCKGKVTTVGNILRNSTEHNHPDNVVVNWVDDGARFPLPLWNHHHPRRNNNLEGFHSRLNRGLPHRHPQIYLFIEVPKKVEHADLAKISQILLGAALRSRKRVYREVENRLCRLKEHLAQELKNTHPILGCF